MTKQLEKIGLTLRDLYIIVTVIVSAVGVAVAIDNRYAKREDVANMPEVLVQISRLADTQERLGDSNEALVEALNKINDKIVNQDGRIIRLETSK